MIIIDYCSFVELRCRCLSSDRLCWPNVTTWQIFNESIDGHLVLSAPSGSACDQKTFNPMICNIVKSQWSNATWRSEQVGGMQNPNWENSSCSILFNDSQCNQGSVPILAVDARSSEHIEATVRFVATHNLRLVIKSTGHDFLGRSTAAGSLLLWVHHMKNITLVEEYTSCDRINVSKGIRIEGGVQWNEVYRWLSKLNLVAIGAGSGTVSAIGGYLQGGGHSPLSRWKGMAADQVLEYDVVTADGQRRRVNACQNKDLFWALNGGGGGTYAIVVSALIRTFPSPSIVGGIYSANASNPTEYTKLIENFIEYLVRIGDDGWTAYFDIFDLTLRASFHLPNGDLTQFNTSLNQFHSKNVDLANQSMYSFVIPSFNHYFTSIIEPSEISGFHFLVSSRLIPESIIRTDWKGVASVLNEAKGESMRGSNLRGSLVAGGEVSNMIQRNNSIHPAWRTALLRIACTQTWLDEISQSDQDHLTTQLLDRTSILDRILPHGFQSASYANEAHPNEINWKEKFYGPKIIYDQLKSIKDKYDPLGLFVCVNCVGSEDWTSDLNCPLTSNSINFNLTSFTLFIHLFFILISIDRFK